MSSIPSYSSSLEIDSADGTLVAPELIDLYLIHDIERMNETALLGRSMIVWGFIYLSTHDRYETFIAIGINGISTMGTTPATARTLLTINQTASTYSTRHCQTRKLCKRVLRL